jgi:alkylation response protein AidB-like acyl-CoA dehydrogenase
VSLALTEEHQALSESVRRFLATHCPPATARAGLDAPAEELPPFWAAFAAQGWLGLAIDAEAGGEGFGLAEVAVVLEELGRVAAPGPFLATFAASALIGLSPEPRARRWLPSLASGALAGAVMFPAERAHDRYSDRRPAGTGLRPVLSGAAAGVVVYPQGDGDELTWWAAEPAHPARELPSLDPTRRLAEVDIEAGSAVPLRIDPVAARGTLAALVAAECAGGAAWCVDTAAGYAQVRVQFGRPIGAFQAVKHRCANMLATVEEIRAAAWDAAGEVAADPSAPESDLAAAVAGAVAPGGFLAVTEDCIQVLGGIGFTWEHDAHRYLRRAASLVALAGPARQSHRRIVRLALAGTRRRPPADLRGDGHDQLRAGIRAEVEAIATLPREERRAAMVDAGLFVPHWARPWGRSAGPVEQLIIDSELERAGLRRPHLAVGAWAAPTIAAYGTPEQQRRWVRPTLLGQIRWCQLFSEPGAGSDLAALSSRATRATGPGGQTGWRLDGQKVWTSMAHEADFGICLARTDPAASRQRGITYFVLDMSAPGIDIRPLREITGAAMFNEVFLEGVFVPDEAVIGEVGQGWELARTTLANERVTMARGSSFGGGIEALLALVADLGPDRLDPVEADQLGRLIGEAHCLAVMGQRSVLRAVAAAGPGPESSVRKLLAAEHDQRTQELGLGLLGPSGATTDGAGGQWSFGFLANRCLTIAGGTSEVQRNVIGERLLGLPRDPGPASP